MESLGTPLENAEGTKSSPLVELNPNVLVWDVERMLNWWPEPNLLSCCLIDWITKCVVLGSPVTEDTSTLIHQSTCILAS